MARHKFHARSFISFCLFISVFWILFSGTILYLAPPGRVAHWQHWTLFGFDKDQWQAQHTIFSYLFVIFTIIHIFSLNWRNLWSYVKLKSKNGFRKKNEFIAAAAISMLIFLGVSYEIPPLSNFFELGDSIGKSWEQRELKAPIPHTENLTLAQVASKFAGRNTEEIIENLRKKGFSVNDESQSLKEIALENELAPAELYYIISPKNKNSKSRAGKGYSRMTLAEISSELDMNVDVILKTLKSNNISVSSSKTIRDIASENDLHPSELMKIIRGDHEI